jgi:hypothetical protein
LIKSARMIESLAALGVAPAALSAPGGTATGRNFHHANPPAISASRMTAATA